MNFAIIGCGRIGQRHAEHISKRGVLVSVCDIIKERADELAEQYGTRAYYDIGDLLKNGPGTDVAAICTPNGLHAEHSIACLNAGINVLCEKPMAIRVKDCEAMITAAERSNKLLAVVKQNRFNAPVIAAKKILDEKRLGAVLSFQLNCFWNREKEYYTESDWKGKAALDGGILFTQFSHFIDLLYWMLGDVSKAQQYSFNYLHKGVIEGEDTGVVILEMMSGAIGTVNYTVNSHKRNMEGSLTLFGEKGTIKIGGEYLNKLEYQEIDDHVVDAIKESGSANNYGNYQGSMSNHDKVYDNLLDVLNNEGIVNASAEDGMKTVEIITKIKRSVLHH